MEVLFVIFVAAAVIWGILKKYSAEQSGGNRTSSWNSPTRRYGYPEKPSRPMSLLDELRQRHEREQHGGFDAADPVEQTGTKRIPINEIVEAEEVEHPIPIASEVKKPEVAPARTSRPPEKRTARRTPPPIPVKLPSSKPSAPKRSVAPTTGYVLDQSKSARPSTKEALADYQKQIGGAVWDERVNRIIRENLPPGEEFLATVIGNDASVLVVSDRRIAIIRPGDNRTFDSTDYRVGKWEFSGVKRLDLAKDWLRCRLTIVTGEDPAPPENIFTYQRLYHDKVETLVESLRQRLNP